ncbi:MAG TPA: hypothetical protein VEH06_11345 [Candidatus Bathyarchaeia archaeon]|nr:hypothetical protein [Candidatus Bathyarchaeia archaeon]
MIFEPRKHLLTDLKSYTVIVDDKSQEISILIQVGIISIKRVEIAIEVTV